MEESTSDNDFLVNSNNSNAQANYGKVSNDTAAANQNDFENVSSGSSIEKSYDRETISPASLHSSDLSTENVDQNLNESDIYTPASISGFIKTVRAAQGGDSIIIESSEEKVKRLCEEIKTLEIAYRYMTAETIDDVLEVYKSTIPAEESKSDDEITSAFKEQPLLEIKTSPRQPEKITIQEEMLNKSVSSHINIKPFASEHLIEENVRHISGSNTVEAKTSEIVDITIGYIEIYSVIFGKFQLPSRINMQYRPPSENKEKKSIADKKTKSFQVDPREFMDAEKTSEEYEEVEQYLRKCKNYFNFENHTTKEGDSILSIREAATRILSFFEIIEEASNSGPIDILFNDSSSCDIFLFIFQDLIEEQEELRTLVNVKCLGEPVMLCTTSYAKKFKTKFPYSRRISSNANIIFLDLNFIEYENGSDFTVQKSSAELTSIGAYCTQSFDGSRLRWDDGLEFHKSIAPGWLMKEAAHFSKVSEMEYMKKLKLVWRGNRNLDKKELCTMETGEKCIDEKTAIEKFCKYVEHIKERQKTKEIIIVVFASPYVYADEYDTILPLRILLSKIREYHLEETFYKCIVGYADLLTNEARKHFSSIFKDRYNRNTDYFHLKKGQALDIIKEYEKVMNAPWPLGKSGNQALGGLMSLIANVESDRLIDSLSLYNNKLRMESKYLYTSLEYITRTGRDVTCSIRKCNFQDLADVRTKINLVIPLPINERYHHAPSKPAVNTSYHNYEYYKSNKKIDHPRDGTMNDSSVIKHDSGERSRSSSYDRSRSNSRERHNHRKSKKRRAKIYSNFKDKNDGIPDENIKGESSKAIRLDPPGKSRSRSRDRIKYHESQNQKNRIPFSPDRNYSQPRATCNTDERQADVINDLRFKIRNNRELEKRINSATSPSNGREEIHFKIRAPTSNVTLEPSPMMDMEIEEGEVLDD